MSESQLKKLIKMKNLSGLTAKIRQWNSMGLSMLPTLEFAIIHSSNYDKDVFEFLKAFGQMELLYDEKAQQPKPVCELKKEETLEEKKSVYKGDQLEQKPQEQNKPQNISGEEGIQNSQKKQAQQIMPDKQNTASEQKQKIFEKPKILSPENKKIQKKAQQIEPEQEKISPQVKQTIPKKKSLILQWDQKLLQSIYAIYLTNQTIEARVHLIIDQQIGGNIDDQTLKHTKKIIQRLKRNKNIIFVNFNTTIHKLDAMSDHIELFGLSFKTKQRQIKVDQVVAKAKGINKTKNQHRNRTKVQHNDKKVVTNAKQQIKGYQKPLNTILSPLDIKKSRIPNLIQKTSLPPKQKLPIAQKIDPFFSTNVRQKLNGLFNQNTVNLTQILIHQIEKKYLNIFGVDINRNFIEIKAYHKQIMYELKRYEDIMKFIQEQKDFQTENMVEMHVDSQGQSDQLKNNKKQKSLTSYGLNCLHQAKQYLVSSLWGTYSNIKVYQRPTKSPISTRRSLHWQIMQIMNQIWDIEGDFLIKQLDKMPLSYIQQRYKMLDYQTISGFMPSSCFQAIFAGPLKKMVQHIMETLEIVQMKIVNEVKNVLEYFFAMTNLSDELADTQAQEVKRICAKFRVQTQKVLKSQIEFISVSHEDFWSFKQIKSSLYGPQQQAYIEIKYIGKNYTKKVFDNIRETLPRLIGQNLLREIVVWLQSRSVQIFMALILQKGLQIQISEREKDWIHAMKVNEKKVDRLVYFFSLKTNSQTNVKHLHQNMQKNWNRMFKNPVKHSIRQEKDIETERKGGFFEWAKNLLKRNKQPEKKRSSSQQKQNRLDQPKLAQNPQTLQTKKQSALTQKNWLLIINIDKAVQQQKIKRSSQQGFPQRLRPSIWLYLAKRQLSSQIKKVQTFLKQGLNPSSPQQKAQLVEIYKQIDKDVNRTPPANLFRKGYLKDTLTRVLQAYSIYDKQIRYTQGMNFIVGIILCVLTHHGENCEYVEERVKSKGFFEVLQNQCFLIFMYIMERKGLRKIMFIERATITDLCVRLQEWIKRKSLVMHQKIQRSGFNVEIIFSGALISGLTTSEIQFRLQKRVVDLLLAHEFNVLYKVIGQFVATAQSLCGNMENQTLYYFLKGTLYNDVYQQIGDDGLSQMFHNL